MDAMDAFTRFTNQTQGGDRLFRATQYTCMLLRYLLEPKAGKEKVVMKLKKLESSVSTGRKCFRLGNVVHAVQAEILILGLGLNGCWVSFFFLSFFFFFVFFRYEISLQMERIAHDRAKREKSQDPLGHSVADEEPEWLQSFLLLLFQSLKQHPPLLLDTVKNFCDILNPLDQLGIYKSNPGVVGLGGLLSSIAGIITVVYPQMKLKIR
ncbi:PREDICTED: peroxisomal membrane protein 11A-like [Galeopterus variegatus]|uniref:Peroxisomal membrane protein 11A-like n=1 Tax=Galeopterus variegatus TaxID=482537 RepID=A0ABM0QS50_GALVR|nr:PREDICTED: peroxisomal membrane protein 11A-like [Galeopterus variegatus]